MPGEDIPKIGARCPHCGRWIRFRVVFGEPKQFRAEHDLDVCGDYEPSLEDAAFLEGLLLQVERLPTK